MLADMATEIEAARALVYATARMIDNGVKNYSKESAMCKYFASGRRHEGDDRCRPGLRRLRLYEGIPPGEDDAGRQNLQIYEGTNQIQRNIVAANLLKEF